MMSLEAGKMDAEGRSIVSDLQSQFEARAGRGDFLTAAKVDDVVGLCLSGGGYRAMLYHTGALVRLGELGVLQQLREIASVSGGSIAAAALALAWDHLRFRTDGRAENLEETFVIPVIRMARVGIDVRAILIGMVPGCSAAGEVAKAYDRNLLRGATLQDLPDRPRFTFMATNLQTGSGWRFAKEYAADHRVGRIERPKLPLSQVVAASSAFPPFLSPVQLRFEPSTVRAMEGTDLHRRPFTESAILTDGGVYDNLGLERVWRRCRTILVSNAGRSAPELGRPTGRWMGQVVRSLNLAQQQAEDCRKRILFGVHNLGQRTVVYWSIDIPIGAYGVADSVGMTSEATMAVAGLRTRLNRFAATEVQLLLRAGYAGADASIRSRGLCVNAAVADIRRLSSLCDEAFGIP